MNNFNEIYLQLMPIVAGFGAGYEVAQDNLSVAIGYSIVAALFLTENILKVPKGNSKTLEEIL